MPASFPSETQNRKIELPYAVLVSEFVRKDLRASTVAAHRQRFRWDPALARVYFFCLDALRHSFISYRLAEPFPRFRSSGRPISVRRYLRRKEDSKFEAAFAKLGSWV